MDLAMTLIRASYDEPPTQKGPTSRRNPFGIPRSTWSRMMREELGLRAYKVFNIAMYFLNAKVKLEKFKKIAWN